MADAGSDRIDRSEAFLEGELDQLLTKIGELKDELDRQSKPDAFQADTPAPTQQAPLLRGPGSGHEGNDPLAGPSAASDEITVDAGTERVADEEIAQAVVRLEALKRQPQAQTSDEAGTDDPNGPVHTPFPFKAVVVFLAGVDHMFLWLPRRVKECLGYIALSTLLLGAILWMLILFF